MDAGGGELGNLGAGSGGHAGMKATGTQTPASVCLEQRPVFPFSPSGIPAFAPDEHLPVAQPNEWSQFEHRQ
jgi:hypothetical protein